MSTKKTPIVAIVGRTNVGKSSFFNAVLREKVAITADEPGTTRDSITAKASWMGKDFWLVDTAGMKDPEDDFEFTIQEQIAQAADSADVILMMIDAQTALSDDDRRLAKMVLKTRKPVLLLANKVDRVPRADPDDYRRLGIKEVFLTSATQSKGIAEALAKISELIPKATIKIDKNRIKVAILGRPNVGKSSLFNVLAKKQQAIVGDRAGTTRDINRVTVRYKSHEVELLDTAGIRRSGKIGVGVEKFSVIRSLAAIEEADACLLLMDVSELNVQLDQKIAGLVKEAGKGLVLVVSKWDSALEKDEFTRDHLAPQISHNFSFVPWAPLIFTSSKTGQNIVKIFDIILDIKQARAIKINTPKINRWLKQIADRHPPAGLKNSNPKLNYIVQEDDNPSPTFKVFGHQTRLIHWSYTRFMERQLREEFGFYGTPVKFWFFDKKR